jgi:NAD(P)-dependent dehydrogenase (short-subunit alcohol dehydrogenase family)
MAAEAVLVTGATGGLGQAFVAALAVRGIRLACVDTDQAALDKVLAEHDVDGFGRAADVSDEPDVRAVVSEAVSRWGRLDGLVNVAAVLGRPTPFTEAGGDEFDRVMAVNAKGTWLTMKHAIAAMVASGGGSIVNVGSLASIRGGAGIAAYTASKHAVVGLTKTVALEFAARGITANVVSPGSMDAPMSHDMFPLLGDGDVDAGRAVMLARIPQGRLAQPAEVAATGVWLLLDAPRHLTGQVITLDGARSAG